MIIQFIQNLISPFYSTRARASNPEITTKSSKIIRHPGILNQEIPYSTTLSHTPDYQHNLHNSDNAGMTGRWQIF